MKPKDLAAQVAAFPHGKVPSALRREQILAEAHQLFVERGYHGASMDELARRVGVSKPLIYNLAGSKEQLFRDVMAKASAELGATLVHASAAEPTLEGKLRAGIRAFFQFVREHEQGWLMLLSTEAGPATSEVAEMRRLQATNVAALLAEHLNNADPTMDSHTTEALAHAVNGAVEFVASWWLTHREVPVESLADLLTRVLTHGLTSLSSHLP